MSGKPTDYLRSIKGNLDELHRLASLRLKRGEVSLRGLEVLADNRAWLADYIKELEFGNDE